MLGELWSNQKKAVRTIHTAQVKIRLLSRIDRHLDSTFPKVIEKLSQFTGIKIVGNGRSQILRLQ